MFASHMIRIAFACFIRVIYLLMVCVPKIPCYRRCSVCPGTFTIHKCQQCVQFSIAHWTLRTIYSTTSPQKKIEKNNSFFLYFKVFTFLRKKQFFVVVQIDLSNIEQCGCVAKVYFVSWKKKLMLELNWKENKQIPSVADAIMKFSYGSNQQSTIYLLEYFSTIKQSINKWSVRVILNNCEFDKFRVFWYLNNFFFVNEDVYLFYLKSNK